MDSQRERAVAALAEIVCDCRLEHPVRVAVDGITASGKSTLACELTAAVAGRGRPAIHLTMDGFHNRRAHRHRQGRMSATGYYEDAYDFPAFAREVLRPLGPGGDRRYRTAVIDLDTDATVDEAPIEASSDAVLIVDGSFLQRPDLAPHWDRTIFVNTSFALARARGIRRDADAFGSAAKAEQAFDLRYHAAARRYLEAVRPERCASIVFDNDDPTAPALHVQPQPRAGVTPRR